ncbi:DUF979 domain-containing protein [Oceanobacillus indicireducens]|uniref:Membrane protein n=1 Tax=Oceanobacillus indicireducens TaxID=1004261 RepID=A0A917XTL3_9BACI|nr:DUF979 domain-containing protein [Oceanobacillus indicireducens]GGN53127.1 membrane protein [Oceanobacillus indicireducens]
METFFANLLEFFFILIGIQLVYTAVRVFMDETNPTRLGSGLFWLIIGVLFAVGEYIPSMISGILVVILGVLTLFKQVNMGDVYNPDPKKADAESDRLNNKIFIPVILLALIALVVATIIPESSASVIGISSVIATIVAVVIIKPKNREILIESDRMVQQVGTTGMLPQLLAALGVIFTISGVGDVIADIIGGIVPEGSQLAGVIAYVMGMVIFSMIMGNAFAAFTVITAGIGVPFVMAAGGDPVIASALAMTAGFCGTLLTPMAGNFNALPVALLQMKDQFGVIKAQAPVAVTMIVIHIGLMYFWAF